MGVKQSIALEVEELNKVQLAYTDYVIMKDMYNDFKTDEYMSKLRDARVSYELAYRAILMKYAPNHQNWEISFETGELLLK